MGLLTKNIDNLDPCRILYQWTHRFWSPIFRRHDLHNCGGVSPPMPPTPVESINSTGIPISGQHRILPRSTRPLNPTCVWWMLLQEKRRRDRFEMHI
ncbi:hypothetical protein JTE90_000728 [Oedothorax gibbosus]|uniref:Uncharacterized protein n=1 Tax=Oedothorax gibbosus TaxID=931172 RepID=A0AAV6UND1_9ARAC|nr:hypothetical protein JTE90_000728 [Oedothorax gibbosus]